MYLHSNLITSSRSDHCVVKNSTARFGARASNLNAEGSRTIIPKHPQQSQSYHDAPRAACRLLKFSLSLARSLANSRVSSVYVPLVTPLLAAR